MRATLDASLPDSAVIWRPARVPDGQGGGSTSWAEAGTYPARIGPTGGAESVIAAKLTATTTWTVTLPASTDVRPEDEIAIGVRRLKVAAVLAPRTWEVSRRVLCMEVG